MTQKFTNLLKQYLHKNLLIRKLVLGFLIGINFSSFSQSSTYFNKQYNLYSNSENAFSIVEKGANYFACGFGANSLTQSFIDFYCIDSVGNYLWHKEYGKPSFHYYPGWGGSLVKTNDGGFALGGDVVDSTNHEFALLMKFNNVGDTLWTKTFGNDSNCVAYQCKQTSDHGYVLVGSTDINAYWEDVLLIKTDSLGNEQWRQTFGGTQQDIGTSIIQTSDGGYLIGGYTYSYGANDNNYVVKTDSLGNVIWQKVLGGIFDDGTAIVIQTNDGNYVIAGTWTFVQYGGPGIGNPHGKPYIAKLDTAGNTIWSKTYGAVKFNTTLMSIHELPNGDLVGAGFCKGYHMEGLLLKTNHNGDSLWYRSYSYQLQNDNYFYYSTPTNDNGFIACGNTLDPQMNENMWIVKFDSFGCDTAGCNTVGILPITLASSAISVFPNPSNGVFTISNSHSGQGKKLITIFDLFGRIVNPQINFSGNEIIIDLTQYSSGIYLLEIRSEDGSNIYSQKIIKE